VFVGADGTAKLINFEHSATLEDHTPCGIPRCTQEDLLAELGQVKSILYGEEDRSSARKQFVVSERRYSLPWTDVKECFAPVVRPAEDAMSTDPVLSSFTIPTIATPMSFGMTLPSMPDIASQPDVTSHSTISSRRSLTLSIAANPNTADIGVTGRDDYIDQSIPYSSASRYADTYLHLSTRSAKPPYPKLRPKIVAFHPDTEDNWIWATNCDPPRHRTPTPNCDEITTPPDDISEGSLLEDFQTQLLWAAAPASITRASGSKSQPQDLTYYEPPPHRDYLPTEETIERESMVKIIITTPAGEDQIWEARQSFAMELGKMLDMGQRSANEVVSASETVADQLLTGAACISRKRKAQDEEEELPKRRRPLSEAALSLALLRANKAGE
jgi:hypothetical protein